MEYKLCKRGHIRSPENVAKNGTCKICNAIAVKEWNEKNKEKRAAISKKYKDGHKEQIAEQGRIYFQNHKEERKAYNEANAEKQAAYFKESNKTNIEKIRECRRSEKEKERRKTWRQKNKDKVNKATKIRQLRLKYAFVAPVSKHKIFERDNWICQICGLPTDKSGGIYHPLYPSIDHKIPLSRGGTHEPDNVHCTHLRCNSEKNTKTMEELDP